MTPSQCRAARGLLNWTQDEMASAAHLSVVTVRNFENEKSTPQRATLDVIQRALEAAGVEFTNGEQPVAHGRRQATAAHCFCETNPVRLEALVPVEEEHERFCDRELPPFCVMFPP
jgi:transcriptional regulator with XRE-family HTH domain